MRAGLGRATAFVVILLLSACGGGGGGSSSPAGAGQAPADADTARADDATPARPLALRDPQLRQKLDHRLLRARGQVEVWVTLDQPSVGALKADRLTALGVPPRVYAQAARERSASASVSEATRTALARDLASHRTVLAARQTALANQVQSVGATVLARVELAHNAVALRVDAAALPRIAQMEGVARIRPVVNYEREPLTARAKAQATPSNASTRTIDGRGVRVAVLDSGIDYTHYNLGGPGTTAAYDAAFGSPARDGLFPTRKVIGGHDFVGDNWPSNGDTLEPDSDPIDAPGTEGHGTHVADILAGRSADGRHRGVAPGASLIAVKVCSSVATTCSGIAIMQGLNYVLDPNGDGDIDDAVDVVNLSLGSAYGQIEDDSTFAVTLLERLGVVVVAAAGNDGNKPYIVSSASVAPAALSVAQTTEPDAKAYPLVITAPASLRGSYANTAALEWAPIDRAITQAVIPVGLGCPESTFPPTVAGRIALIDRGSCNVSAKVDVAARAGAVAVLIANNVEGDAPGFSLGEGSLFVPTLVITLELADRIKAALSRQGVNATLSPANAIDLSRSMVSTSARGPSYSWQTIKPEIGAPGATVSALSGSGNLSEPFGGTSGATPVVAGSAALLVQAFPQLTPLQIKALLMNSAETGIYHNRAQQPGVLAPVTRVGAGEVRVQRALALRSLAYSADTRSASLSFGFLQADRRTVQARKLVVQNLGTQAKTYTVSSSFRDPQDAASGAVRLTLPRQVTVPARGSRELTVTIEIDARKLPAWTLNGGDLGGSGELLDGVEFDGHIRLTAGAEKLSVPWHVLPRKSADFAIDKTSIRAGRETVRLSNAGVAPGAFDVFSLTGVSPRLDYQPLPGSGQALIDLRAVGARQAQLEGIDVLQIAIATRDRRSHPAYPAWLEVYIDANRDGSYDYLAFNAEDLGFGETGQTVIVVEDLATGLQSAYFYADADLNSRNAIFTLPMEALGLRSGASFDFAVIARDNYFSGLTTDALGPMTYAAGKPRYAPTRVGSTPIAPGASRSIGASVVAGGAAASPSQQGFLLMYRQDSGTEADVVFVR